jgi:hypothetical protein
LGYNTQKLLLAGSLFLGSMNALYGCSACGCSTSPGWENQGFVSESGWMVDLREDYIDQNKLMSGTHTVNDSDKLLPNDREIEDYTTQYYTTLSVDYKSKGPLGLTLSIPYVDRSHATVIDGETEKTYSHTKSLGDIRLVGRYQLDTMGGAWGLRLGVKAPTGSYTKTFTSGPEAGSAIDRGLQPGTGTTDVMLGAYYYANVSDTVDYFVQAGYKTPLSQREGYKSGNQVTGDAGIRWIGMEGFVPQLNMNTKYEQKDKGENADTLNSGGQSVYLSPGVTVDFGNNIKGYGFIQLPVYLDVNGYQLVSQWNGTLGVTYSF